jgi:cyclic dehypoxanthinyl futalosine synthase
MDVSDVLAGLEKGGRLSDAEAVLLYKEADLLDLGEVALAARGRAVPGERVTYLVDRNINYTNVCVTDCQFCAFYRPWEKHPDAYVLPREEIGRKIRELLEIGGTRILMQGGHHPDLRLPWYVDLLRWIRSEFPALQIDAFSPSEIDHVAGLEGISTREVLETFREAGLDGLPGGGAEMLDDEVRRSVSPKKQGAGGWLAVMEEAQELGLATTATNVIGLGETIEQRVGHFRRIREHQERALERHGNGFIAFISWTVQLENTPLGRSKRRETMGASSLEYLRHVAVARLYLDNVAHHQASWPTQGEKIAQMGLVFGCDDFGSTMMEENVVSAAGTSRMRMAREDLERHIREAGFVPCQRDTRYQLVGDGGVAAGAS